MLNEKREKVIAGNAQKYVSLRYKIGTEFTRLAVMQETVDMLGELEKDGVCVTFRNKELRFELTAERERRITVCYDRDHMPIGCSGRFCYGEDLPTICVSPSACKNGIDAYAAVVHERGHASEETLVLTIDDYEPGTLHHDFLLRMKANIESIGEISMFGMQFHGQVYVNGTAHIGNPILHDLNKAFYRLAITERFAHAIEKKYIEQLDPRMAEIIDLRTSRALNTIRSRYECYELTDGEIRNFIDAAYLNIYLGKQPTNVLETRIMYDVVAALSHQSGYLSHSEYAKTADKSFVSYELAKWNIKRERDKVPIGASMMAHDLKEINKYHSLDEIAKLPKEVQFNNPKLWAYAIANHGERGAQLVFDKDAFLDWCMSKDNDLSDEHMDLIAGHLGRKYSAESRRMAIQRAEELDKERQIAERSAIAEQFSFGIQNDRSNVQELDIDRDER